MFSLIPHSRYECPNKDQCKSSIWQWNPGARHFHDELCSCDSWNPGADISTTRPVWLMRGTILKPDCVWICVDRRLKTRSKGTPFHLTCPLKAKGERANNNEETQHTTRPLPQTILKPDCVWLCVDRRLNDKITWNPLHFVLFRKTKEDLHGSRTRLCVPLFGQPSCDAHLLQGTAVMQKDKEKHQNQL